MHELTAHIAEQRGPVLSTTFGIEEEFVLLDPTTLAPVDRGGEAIARLAGAVGTVTQEFYASQAEYVSPVLATAAEAFGVVRDFREDLGRWGDEVGVIAAGTGTPFRTGGSPALVDDDRYARIADDVGALAPDHHINGLHVHVGIANRQEGVRASNALRPWLPMLLAISVNSPFWAGADTGYESWRALHSRRWTTYGIPPLFTDADDYRRIAGALEGIGATSDPGTLNWNVRLSERLPTVELRVFDAQLDPWSTVALALVARAMVEWALENPPHTVDDVVLDAALWHAARHGVQTTVFSPGEGRLVPAGAAIDELRDIVIPRQADSYARTCVEDLFARLCARDSGAAAQRAAARRGTLAALYRAALSSAPASAALVG